MMSVISGHAALSIANMFMHDNACVPTNSYISTRREHNSIRNLLNCYISGAGCIKKLLKLTMISRNVNQLESRILYLITI